MRDVLLYGLGEVYTVSTPDGTRTLSSKADYDKMNEYIAQYNDAYGIAYRYNITPPKWSDFEAGKGQAILDTLRSSMAGRAQNNSIYNNSSTGVTEYSVLLPVSGNKYFRTTNKAEYEKYTKYVSLYNDCYAIAVKYGFAKPSWAQFENGQGENVLKQYKTLEANKITSDKEEAQRIADAAAAKAKADAERAAGTAAQKAAKNEIEQAKKHGDYEAQIAAQKDLVKAETETAAAMNTANASQTELNHMLPQTYAAPASETEGGIPWWGWALGAAVGGVILFKTFGGKKKRK